LLLRFNSGGSDADNEETELIAVCLELLVDDAIDLFNTFSTKLQWILKEYEMDGVFTDWDNNRSKLFLQEMTAFYNDR
jgi:hypothetical protein